MGWGHAVYGCDAVRADGPSAAGGDGQLAHILSIRSDPCFDSQALARLLGARGTLLGSLTASHDPENGTGFLASDLPYPGRYERTGGISVLAAVFLLCVAGGISRLCRAQASGRPRLRIGYAGAGRRR